jgi:hypothetical protein
MHKASTQKLGIPLPLSQRLRASHVQRVINEGPDPFNESNSVRQLRVVVECGFIFPAGVDVEPRPAGLATPKHHTSNAPRGHELSVTLSIEKKA